MVKAIAALLMLIDHIGAILFPKILILRLIGRFSMPLFAFSIARGFYYSRKKNIKNFNKYAKNLLLFSFLSQIPYHFFKPGHFNIGFTWLVSLYLLKVLTTKQYVLVKIILSIIIFVFIIFLPFDYGLYGVLYPLAFYLFFFKQYKPYYAFIASAVLFAVAMLQSNNAHLQAITLLAVPLIVFFSKHDRMFVLPKQFFYIFYPTHISFLLIAAAFIK